jgi:2-phospho-L-lactate guanylyltransferase (CobY/MobA/RfbA family)
MIEINKTSVFSLPAETQERSGAKITEVELNALTTMLSELMDESVRENFNHRMENHVGSRSTYAFKNAVLEGLKIIHDKIENPNTSESEKKIIALKLQERAEECTPGFHNAVNTVVDSFYAAKNINDLLYRARQDIVARVAIQLSDDVHVNNRCFVLAEKLGYGVFALNRDDQYLNHLIDSVPNQRIEKALEAGFDKFLHVFPMLQGLEDQLRGQLDSSGYEGLKDTAYATHEQIKIESSLKQLFSDDSVVVELQAAQDALSEENKAKEALSHEITDALKAIGLSERQINVFLNPSNMPAMLKQQLQTRMDAFSDLENASLEHIKLQYTEGMAAFGQHTRTRITEANDAFKRKFFVGNEEGMTDINWPNLREMLWQGVKKQQYFEFTNGEDVQLDILMNHENSRDTNMDWTLMIHSLDDFIQAIQYIASEQGIVLIHAMKDKLPDIIGDTFEFSKILISSLNEVQRTAMVEAIKNKLLKIIFSSENFSNVLQFLNEVQRTVVYEAMKDKLPEMIGRGDDFSNVLRFLNEVQRTAVYETTKSKLPDIINEHDEFPWILESLTPEQRIALIDAMKNKLSDIIYSCDNFSRTMKYLVSEQRMTVIEVMKKKLPDMIKTREEFMVATEYLSYDEKMQCAYVHGNIDFFRGEVEVNIASSINILSAILSKACKDGRVEIVHCILDRLVFDTITNLNLREELEKLGLENNIIDLGLEQIHNDTLLLISSRPEEFFSLNAQNQLRELILNQLKQHVYDTTSTLGSKIQHHKNPMLDKLFGITPKQFLDFKKLFQALNNKQSLEQSEEQQASKGRATP